MNRLLKGLNARRVKWIDSRPATPGTIGSLTHAAPCGPPVNPEPQKPEAHLGVASVGPDKFYSPESQQLNIEGNVVVRAHVAASGCLERVEIQASSGVPDLDSSALRYADVLQYVPAFDGKKAAGGSFPFRVRFQLKE